MIFFCVGGIPAFQALCCITIQTDFEAQAEGLGESEGEGKANIRSRALAEEPVNGIKTVQVSLPRRD